MNVVINDFQVKCELKNCWKTIEIQSLLELPFFPFFPLVCVARATHFLSIHSFFPLNPHNKEAFSWSRILESQNLDLKSELYILADMVVELRHFANAGDSNMRKAPYVRLDDCL